MKNLNVLAIADWLRRFCGLALGSMGVAILITLVSGCVGGLTGPGAFSELSPDQIKAMQALEVDVYACAVVAGPPPSGKIVSVYVPRLDKKPDIKFGDNCVIK
jgi:hypothetical protein